MAPQVFLEPLAQEIGRRLSRQGARGVLMGPQMILHDLVAEGVGGLAPEGDLQQVRDLLLMAHDGQEDRRMSEGESQHAEGTLEERQLHFVENLEVRRQEGLRAHQDEVEGPGPGLALPEPVAVDVHELDRHGAQVSPGVRLGRRIQVGEPDPGRVGLRLREQADLELRRQVRLDGEGRAHCGVPLGVGVAVGGAGEVGLLDERFEERDQLGDELSFTGRRFWLARAVRISLHTRAPFAETGSAPAPALGELGRSA